LNVILGWVALMRHSQIEAPRIPNVLQTIERNARAQARLIADVLDVSRMITGRISLNLESVTLPLVLTDAVKSVRPAAEAKGVELRIREDLAPSVVTGDGERLQQVFWNLLSNAVKFTPRGGHVDVTIARAGSFLDVAVADTGVGLAPGFLPFAFDRFRQADQSFTRAHGGLGLGLAIVKHLVELHGGQVTASSNGIGRGATFSVRLPVAALSPLSTRESREGGALSGGRFTVPDLSDRSILVVDDDVATRKLLQSMLLQCRAHVEAVDSACAAIDRLDTYVPALILADIGMPQEDGLSMMRRIRRRPAERGGTVPSVALSAYARAEDREAALAAGFDDFLSKPAMPEDIFRTVERWLTAHRS
jgi:CheY-like chemotaxis protein